MVLQTQTSPTETIEYRPYARADEDQIVDLLRVAMKMQDFPDLQGFWRWKHYENPFGESPGLVAVADGRMVGVRVFLRWEWHTGDRVYQAVRCVDTATHPEWGRRGIFERLTTGMIESLPGLGVDFIFNTPNQYSMPGYLKMGWVHVGALPLNIRPRRPINVAAAMVRRQKLGGASEITGAVDNTAVLELLRDPSVRALVETEGARPDARLHTARTPAYLEWRYGRNRWYGYRAGFDSRGSSAALAVCRVSRRGPLKELLVCDLVTRPDRRSRRLATGIVGRLAREIAADYVAVSGLSTPLGIASGFIPVGNHGRDLTVRHLETKLAVDPTALGAWAASFGDLELF
jgi:hypothetical protein